MRKVGKNVKKVGKKRAQVGYFVNMHPLKIGGTEGYYYYVYIRKGLFWICKNARMQECRQFLALFFVLIRTI